jgi:hypothetical protein
VRVGSTTRVRLVLVIYWLSTSFTEHAARGEEGDQADLMITILLRCRATIIMGKWISAMGTSRLGRRRPDEDSGRWLSGRDSLARRWNEPQNSVYQHGSAPPKRVGDAKGDGTYVKNIWTTMTF